MKMKYTVVTGNTHADFIIAVNELIAKGWALQGGVSMSDAPPFYAQALVLIEK
ncbi:MAG TPA: DUF1737 domain-containing protein [Patescibacteria group bacterium]|nr:DUF1737 domain-containing protein [Patescibacteria group bacterium]